MCETLMQDIVKVLRCSVWDVLNPVQPVYPDVIGTSGMQLCIYELSLLALYSLLGLFAFSVLDSNSTWPY